MERIASFSVNHDLLDRGIYISRIDGDAVTYDIRMKKPNCGVYLSNPAIHTIEHLFATYVRNSKYSEKIIYFGPMGCRTGFYFIVRDCVSHNEIIDIIKNAFKFITEFTGEIPGTKREECGNYMEHDLNDAKQESLEMLLVLKNYKEKDMYYKQ